MAGEPILIVDDNPVNLKLARVLLTGEGYQVRTAADAEEALEVLHQFKPRLILMDIQLPGMDGLEATAMLKRDDLTRTIPVIALTALAMKVAGKAIRLLVLLGAGLIIAGLGTYEVKKVQRRWRHDDVSNVASA